MFDIYERNDFFGRRGAWRDDFDAEQAHEAAIACDVLHAHNRRISARIDASTLAMDVLYRHEEALEEDAARADPEAFALQQSLKLHTIHLGDCEYDCGCEGGCDCPHGWCQFCAEAAVKERRARGATGIITVRFGYSPGATATVSTSGVFSPLSDESPKGDEGNEC